MAVFAVTYKYVDDTDAVAAVRPTHRAWLTERLKAGDLLASGPMIDMPTALLIWQGESLEQISSLLNDDPFDIAGLIEERTIQQWNAIFGPFAKHLDA